MDRSRLRRLVASTAVAAGVALASLAVAGTDAGAHGTGITADCYTLTAVKPMDTVRVLRADGTQHTFDVPSLSTWSIPGPNAHGRVTGVYVTFDDGEKADTPVPDCPNPTTSTTSGAGGSSTTSSLPDATTTSTGAPAGSSTTTEPPTSTTAPAEETTTTVGGQSVPSTTGRTGAQATTTAPRVGGVTAATTGRAASEAAARGGGGRLPTTGSGLVAAWAGVTALAAGVALFVGARRRNV